MSWKSPPWPIGELEKSLQSGVLTADALEEMLLLIGKPPPEMSIRVNPTDWPVLMRILQNYKDANGNTLWSRDVPTRAQPNHFCGVNIREDEAVPTGYYRLYDSCSPAGFTELPLVEF